jgi:dTDP-4-dehydrorhamnose 3,5-epimerase-like enzyme
LNLAEVVQFRNLGDSRGSLVALESGRNIPFEFKRVYYIYGMQNDVPRGFHAHKKLRQIAVCLSGSCSMLLDDGINKEKIPLNSPEAGVLIDAMVWHEMHDFSDDCVLLVLADDFYDESDYIRDYDRFIEVAEV